MNPSSRRGFYADPGAGRQAGEFGGLTRAGIVSRSAAAALGPSDKKNQARRRHPRCHPVTGGNDGN